MGSATVTIFLGKDYRGLMEGGNYIVIISGNDLKKHAKIREKRD